MRVEDNRGVFAAIFREEQEETAHKLYQRFVECAEENDFIVEMLNEEFSIVHIYFGCSKSK